MNTGQKVAITGIVVSGALAVAKIVAGLLGHSTSVVADGFESAGDVFASGFVLLGLTLASKPADARHPYGHGRIETLTGLFIGIGLMAVGALICYRALENIGADHAPPSTYVIWPLIASAVLKAGLSSLKLHYGRKLESAALVADAYNDGVDILSALTALVAVGLTLYDPGRFLAADHYGGFAVGIIVIITGLRVARETSSQLIDTMPDDAHMNEIRQAAMGVAGVRGVEKCFARKTGFQYHVDLHLEVDPEITVRESHEIATRVRIRIRESLHWVADVLVHVEPAPAWNEDSNPRL
ncbi:MAG: cation diffusion facilitator family transporter [Acidobacteria bacterium]|nr:cation diffusion facilitator family transporter [Acidobacteriota bacterium]